MITITITEEEYEYIIMYRKEVIIKNIEECKKIMSKFIEECIEEEEDSRLTYNTIWKEYKFWCKQNLEFSIKPFEKQPFKIEIDKIYGKINIKGWKGIKIRSIEINSLSDE